MKERLLEALRWPSVHALVAGVVGLLVLVLLHTFVYGWEPRGSDWDSWYLSALSFRNPYVGHPPTRWPVHGALVALLQALSFGTAPLIRCSQALALLSAATMAGSAWYLGRRLLGPVAAFVAWALLLSQPLVIEFSDWVNAYPLWAGGGALAAASICAGARRPRQPAAFVLAGVGAMLVWASLAKGLPMALGLTALGLVAAASHGRQGLLPAGLFLLPIALAALSYSVLPFELLSLQDQALLVAEGGLDGPEGERGYVFGQSMGPRSILDAFTLVDGVQGRGWRDSRLDHAFPGGLVVVGLAGVGAALGLGRALWRLRERRVEELLGWLGLLVLFASVAPSAMASVPQVRFVLPAALFLALGLTALPGLLGEHPRARWLALLALPACWIPALPTSAMHTQMDALVDNVANGGPDRELEIFLDLRAGWPEQPLVVVDPIRGGFMALEGRSGRMIGGHDARGVRVETHEMLLVPFQQTRMVGAPARELGQPPLEVVGWEQRTVLAAWREREGRQWLVLVGPAG